MPLAVWAAGRADDGSAAAPRPNDITFVEDDAGGDSAGRDAAAEPKAGRKREGD